MYMYDKRAVWLKHSMLIYGDYPDRFCTSMTCAHQNKALEIGTEHTGWLGVTSLPITNNWQLGVSGVRLRPRTTDHASRMRDSLQPTHLKCSCYVAFQGIVDNNYDYCWREQWLFPNCYHVCCWQHLYAREMTMDIILCCLNLEN